MSLIFQVPACIEKISTMQRCLRLVVDTQENINDDAKARLMSLHNKIGWFTFSVRQVEAEDLLNLPEIKTDSTKTPSQRLRGVLFRLWEQDKNGYDTFETYYINYMEKIIEKLKEKLT